MKTQPHLKPSTATRLNACAAAVMLLLGLGASGPAQAVQECQPGFVPAHQGRHLVCVADYSLPFWKQQPVELQQNPGEVWEDRYGIAAYSNAMKSYLIHTGALTEAAARQSLLDACGPRCEILGTFKNSCAAIGWGAGLAHLKTGHSLQQAQDQALAACRADPSSRIACEVLYSDCSFPTRLR